MDTLINKRNLSSVFDHWCDRNIALLTLSVYGEKRYGEIENLSADLKKLGYGFTKVDSKDRTTYIIACPVGFSLSMAIQDMINLADRYGIEDVIIWDHERRDCVLYDAKNNTTVTKQVAWNQFSLDGSFDLLGKKGPVTITDIEVVESCLNPTTPVFRISHFRKEMFGRWY